MSFLNTGNTLQKLVFIFSRLEGPVLGGWRLSRYILDLLWGFTESDFATFVVPDMAFGLLGALSRSLLINGDCPSRNEIFRRVPVLLAFNWTNLLVFDLANQRSPGSVAEDRINKPWRPIPTGKISPQQTRRTMLVIVPLSMCLNYHLGVWVQGSLIHLITWLYNDLGGGDEVILREVLIAVGYAMFNSGSLKISACGRKERERCQMNSQGLAWTGIISAVIFTTMQIQDLKDQRGDQLRGRKTVVLFLGQEFSRSYCAGADYCLAGDNTRSQPAGRSPYLAAMVSVACHALLSADHW
ncbi:hypothetical protein KVR01_002488 [Diaporthe batatas]|uniref:uncharacterized protein n=1 Tax=Diaporthe batatas TaxID=748121 RepID=UPI001D037C60|nr:uncharacterized protein KVR01_002488 [Diaporthe batatas]KAG8166799.1 hypothetical protein KVR01_002488 [Diaporthe batatas]